MNQTREEQICNELLHIWAKVYDFREELGEKHELYDSLYKLSSDINSVESNFRKFLKKEESTVIGVTMNS